MRRFWRAGAWFLAVVCLAAPGSVGADRGEPTEKRRPAAGEEDSGAQDADRDGREGPQRDTPRGLRDGRPDGPWQFGRGGPPGPMNQRRLLVKTFDKDGDGRLDDAERAEARKAAREGGGGGFPFGRRFPPFFGRGERAEEDPETTVEPARLSPEDVDVFPDRPLYDLSVLRTVFLRFARDDWEEELRDFYRTDVEVPAEMVVDGKTYPGVGVRFRGNTSIIGVPAGKKRSLNISVDRLVEDQRLLGYKTLNLLNAHTDPSFLRTVLFYRICREYIPAPQANFVRLVINGESWGIYVNVQQFNKDFLSDWFGTKDGVRWKVPQNPGGGASLRHRGDDPAEYERFYMLKTKGAGTEAWQRLIRLFRALQLPEDGTPDASIHEVLDVDEALWFLALDNVFMDSDGYFSRGSDFYIYEDPGGRFHLIPYDSNETFGGGGMRGPGGRGRRFRPGGFRPGGFRRGGFRPGGFRPGGFDPGRPPGPEDFEGPPEGERGRRFAPAGTGNESRPDRPGSGRPPPEGERPQAGEERPVPDAPGRPGGREPDRSRFAYSPVEHESSSERPLIRTLLADSSLRARYIAHVRTIVEEWLDWSAVEPVLSEYRALLGDEIRKDARKLYSTEAYLQSVEGAPEAERRRSPSIRAFIEGRRRYLLSHPAVTAPPFRLRVVSGPSEKDARPSPGDRVRIAVQIEGEEKPRSVWLYHSVSRGAAFTRVPLRDEGSHGDGGAGDGLYAAEIPAYAAGTLVRYYVEARSSGDVVTTAFLPARAEAAPLTYRVAGRFRPSFPVRINEIRAGGGKSPKSADEEGDWIELCNLGSEPADLSGLHLSDNPDFTRRWTFPQGTVIEAGGFLVVHADGGKTGLSGLGAAFRLDGSGETLVLSDRDDRGGSILDRVRYREAVSGFTFGRLPDGEGDLAALVPTPGRANRRPGDGSASERESLSGPHQK